MKICDVENSILKHVTITYKTHQITYTGNCKCDKGSKRKTIVVTCESLYSRKAQEIKKKLNTGMPLAKAIGALLGYFLLQVKKQFLKKTSKLFLCKTEHLNVTHPAPEYNDFVKFESILYEVDFTKLQIGFGKKHRFFYS